MDHSAGLVTFRLMVALCVCPAATLTVAQPRAAVFPAGPVRVDATCTDAAAEPSLMTSCLTWTVAYPALSVVGRSGVVTNVPCRATWTGPVVTR